MDDDLSRATRSAVVDSRLWLVAYDERALEPSCTGTDLRTSGCATMRLATPTPLMRYLPIVVSSAVCAFAPPVAAQTHRASAGAHPPLGATPRFCCPGNPYDFSAVDALLLANLPDLSGHVAVILRQDGVDLHRFQAGDIGYDTKTRLASFTKTISAGVVLAVRDEGALTLGERLGDALPLFESNGLGDPTIVDAFGMRHGITTPAPYEIQPFYTLAQSVTLIGLNGSLAFAPGTQLGYEGSGMQTVGRIVELRTGESWEDVARARIFDRCAMPGADYQQFAPNPAIAGGLRSSAKETIRYAQMIVDRGWFAGERVLSDASIEQMFTNATRGLPVHATPWPASHPLYPYGVDPDYGFGTWILAENPATQHVEEIVGAGAWGSFVWIDRRRGLTAVLITDVPAGSQGALDPALGLFAIARQQVEARQSKDLAAAPEGAAVRLHWLPASGSRGSRVYGSSAAIRDVFDLRAAVLLGSTQSNELLVPAFAHYAVTSEFDALENTALVPGSNSIAASTSGG